MDNVVDVYWTLAVEMQFYVIILVLLYPHALPPSDRVVLWGSLAWSVISWAVVLFTAPHVGSDPQRDPMWVKLLNNATVAEYAPLFVLGMALYIARQTGRHRGWSRRPRCPRWAARSSCAGCRWPSRSSWWCSSQSR